ncbi:hypothetical protein FDENT_8970 [Fusarium denticulatum]|uniref:Uncharacterized protein n=1 Tax=Fusarium denticulatum TaxID=48507 RepID=A0A8H5X245_9HYPO|nr:hypothetical protein FDENT_8970 [Fusarium denticulatum]
MDLLAHIEGIKGSVFPPSIRSNPHPRPRPTPLIISSQPIVTFRQKSRLALVASRSVASASGSLEQQPIFYLTRTPLDSVSVELPGKPLSIQLAATAKASALKLLILDGEDDHACVSTDRGPEHRALRLPNPPGTQANIALYYVKPLSSLNSRVNSRIPTLAGLFWNYSHNFQGDPTMVNFHEEFPGLASAFEEGKFEGEVERFVGTTAEGTTTEATTAESIAAEGTTTTADEQKSTTEVTDVPQYVIVPTSGDNLNVDFLLYSTACPTSWQSMRHKMTEIMAIDSELTAWNLTVDQVAAVLQLWGGKRNINLQLDVIIDGTEPSAQVYFPSNDSTTIWIHNDNASELFGATYNHYSGVDLTAPAESLAPVTEPEHIVDKAQQFVDSIVQKQGTKGFGVPALDNIGEDEGEVPFNNYEEPTVSEYAKAAGFKSADDTPADPAPFAIDPLSHRTAGKADHALAKFLNGITARKFKETNPTHVPGSISEFARGIAEGNPKEWPDVMHAWREKLNDPDAFAVNITKHKEAFRKLMEHAASRIDLAIATPVSLVESASNGPQGNGGRELPQYIDPGLTQEHVLSDIHVLPHRPAGQHVTKHTQLTSHEKVMLFLVFQRLRDNANPPYRLTVSDWQSFLNALFDNWNSRFDPPADPELPARQGKQAQLEVATLNQDHPPSIARQRSVLWTWSDSQKQGVSHQYVTLDRGKTEVSIRQELIQRYNYWERQRIKQHNKDLLVACRRRAIKRWVHDGTGRVSVLNPDEHPKLQKLVLACNIGRSDAARLTEVSRLADASGLGNGNVW